MSSDEPAYSLETNNLSDLVAYATRPAGHAIVSKVSLPAGSLFCPITTATPAPKKRWSTVQTSANDHIELNSALLYMNHSCTPSVEIDAEKMEVRVARDRDLKEGDDLTFFYPSTEWEFDRPFDCLCGAGKGQCVRDVQGAKVLSKEELNKWFINKHILELASAA